MLFSKKKTVNQVRNIKKNSVLEPFLLETLPFISLNFFQLNWSTVQSFYTAICLGSIEMDLF